MKLRFPKTRRSRGYLEAAALQLPELMSFEGSLDIEAASQKADGTPDTDKPVTVTLSANSGIPMEIRGFPHPVIIDMKGARFDKPVTPVLQDHDVSERIGHTIEQKINPSSIIAKAVVSSVTDTAKSFVSDARRGFPFQVSVGAKVEKHQLVRAGDSVEVNGKSWKGPLIVARSARIRELTVTVLGADADTEARIAASLFSGVSTMDFDTWVQSMGFTLATLSDSQKAGLQATFDRQNGEGNRLAKLEAAVATLSAGDPDDEEDDEDDDDADSSSSSSRRRKPSKKKPRNRLNAQLSDEDYLKASREREANEAERRQDINDLLAAYSNVKEVILDGETKATPIKTLRSKAIRDGWQPSQVKLLLLEADRPTGDSFVGIHVSKDMSEAPELFATASEIAILRSIGVPGSKTQESTGQKYGLESWYKPELLEAADKMSRKGMVTLHQLMNQTIRAAGKSYHGNQKSPDFIRATFEASDMLQAAGAGPFSTLTVSNILENVANKNLLAMYMAQEVVWSQLVQIKPLNDFKTNSFYRLSVNGGYKKVGKDGELKHGNFGDQKYTLQADTYGMMLALTRQDMMNDDLNAFADLTKGLGRLAALALEYEVFKLILGNSLTPSDASNGNYIVNVMDIPGYTAAMTKFMNQVDAFGKPILVSPDRVLTGTPQTIKARQLWKDTNLIATEFPTSAAPALSFNSNPHVGAYRPIISPLVNNAAALDMDGVAFAHQSDTVYYFLCDPNVLAAFLVGFVNGRAVPVLESAQTSFDTLGIQWRSYHDFAVGTADYRAVLQSSGVGS